MLTQAFTIFGWKAHRCTLEAGEDFSVAYRVPTLAEASTNWNLWTKGGFDVVSTPPEAVGIFPMGRRLAGHVTKRDMAGVVIPAGTYHYKTFEPSEFWCVNYNVNKGALPGLTAKTLLKGEVFTPEIGSLALVASGATDAGDAPQAIQTVTAGKKITAVSGSMLIIFDKRLAAT